MPATMYYDQDADLSLLKGKTIAIIGYGSQGHAQAQNLRDSGCDVVVGQRPGSANYDLAVKRRLQAGLRRRGRRGGRPGQHPPARRGPGRHLRPRHQAPPPARQPAALLARVQHPLRPGRPARGRRQRPGRPQGARPPGPQRVRQGGRRPLPDRHRRRAARPAGKALALAYAKGIGGTRGGVLQTTFAEETETDLFGEQVVLCGGVSALVKMGFETLIEAGYQPESAYFECLHELKLIVDLMYQGGLNYMRYSISNTAEYGDYTRGPRIVNEQTRAEMKKILNEIQTGQFAREWILENKANRPVLQRHQAPRARAPGRAGRQAAPQPHDLDRRQGGLMPMSQGALRAPSPAHRGIRIGARWRPRIGAH